MATDGARVSVALATHNGAAFLPAQLDSLAAQTLPPAELIASDDASTDDTVAILQAFAQGAPFPVRILQSPAALGFRRNFVVAATACAGDLIAFCDQDDIWSPAKLARMAAAFDSPEVLLAYHDARLIDPHGRDLGHQANRGRGVWGIIPGYAQVFARRLLAFADHHAASVDPFHPGEVLAHDQFFVFWAQALGRTVHVAEPLVAYRQHPAAQFGRPAGPLAQWAHDIANARRFALGKADACASRASQLREAARSMSGEDADRVLTLAAAYEAAAPLFDDGARLPLRALRGDYAGGEPGPGWRDMVCDLLSRKARGGPIRQA